VRALLFGVDGTLADTERDGHRPAFNQAFADAGLDWQWDVALCGRLLAVTGGKERIKHYVDRFRPDYRKPRRFEERVAELHRAKTRHYAAIAARGRIPMRPGVKRLLAEARAAGLRLAIATTTPAENVTVLLDHSLGAGTQAWFEVIAAGAAPAPVLMRSADYPGRATAATRAGRPEVSGKTGLAGRLP
jgi:phosphoglycolate phosphatase-like HAD superfamily hydrolase